MEHTHTPAPNGDIKVYANARVFGADHGRWLGFDRIEYVESSLAPAPGTATLALSDARPTAASGADLSAAGRVGEAERLGVMRLAATVELAGETRATAGAEDVPDGTISAHVFRYSFRSGDGFLGWLTSYYNVPYLFGSAGKGARSQAERYVGADCADVIVAALRRAGLRTLEYSSVAGLVDKLGRVAGPSVIVPARRNADATAAAAAAPPAAGKPADPPIRFVAASCTGRACDGAVPPAISWRSTTSTSTGCRAPGITSWWWWKIVDPTASPTASSVRTIWSPTVATASVSSWRRWQTRGTSVSKSCDQIARRGRPLGKLEREAGLEEAPRDDAAALEQQLGVGAQEEGADLGHPLGRRQADAHARTPRAAPP